MTKIEKIVKILNQLKLSHNSHGEQSLLTNMAIETQDIEFGDDIDTIQLGFTSWRMRSSLLSQIERDIEKAKWDHFLNLELAYTALQNLIPLGINANEKTKRKWISYQVQTLLLVDKRAELRIWTALRFLKYLLSNQIITKEALYNSKITPDFFKKLNKDS
ncbi:21768_t:CDS:2, partial [Gigaspora margarita]